MYQPGLVDMLSLFAGLVVAIPLGIVGFEFLYQGRTALGVAFLGLAIIVVWLPEYVRRRLPSPIQSIRQRVFSRFSRKEE